MSKPTFRYGVTVGLHGCYLADIHYGPHEGHTRRELASLIRDYLEVQDMPKMLFERVRITRLWKQIKRYGSSSMHFTLVHKGRELAFYGLTEEEYKQMVAEKEE
jgi:hypothetical protein